MQFPKPDGWLCDHDPDGRCADQSTLFGILDRVRDMNIPLISVIGDTDEIESRVNPGKELQMEDILDTINRAEDEIEGALNQFELAEQLDEALAAYRATGARLAELEIRPGDPAYGAYQRVLAYCLMRQGNILRQLKKPEEALALSELEIAAARASGDQITLARSLMSNGINQIVAGRIGDGNSMLEEARTLFESGDSYTHKQGLGWSWILQADLMNAGLVSGTPAQVVDAADRALAILQPIENWPGVARAYAARAEAHKRLGESAEAVTDQEAQAQAESKIGPQASGE